MRQLKKAYLEITNICNCTCDFCPGTKRTRGFMSAEQFSLLASRLHPHTQYLYLHLMGEPLLHPQLEEILAIAAEQEFKVMLTTNGTLLQQRQDLLCNAPAVKRISISVHSFEGNGNTDGLNDYVETCISFAKRAAQAGKLCVLRLWNLDGEDTQGANSRNGEILTILEQAFPKPWKEGRRGITLASHIFLEFGEKFQWPDLSAPQEDGRRFCYGLRDQIGVLWDGTVVPCCLDHEGDIPLGNLYEQSLEEILNTPRALEIYQGFSQGRASEELCRRCAFTRRFQ